MYVTGFRLNTELLEKLFGEYLISQGHEPEDIDNIVYDYIMDDDFQKNLHHHFPGIFDELKMVKSQNASYEYNFYLGYTNRDNYLELDELDDSKKIALKEFRQKYPEYLNSEKIRVVRINE